MAKRVQSTKLKGFLDMNTMQITEIKKEEENVYDFLEILRNYDEKEVTISISEEEELKTVEEE